MVTVHFATKSTNFHLTHEVVMKKYSYFIGVDIASATFTAAIYNVAAKSVKVHAPFQNDTAGFSALEQWLYQEEIPRTDCLICLEATGVYGEAFCYYLCAKGYKVALESPDKVKRAFKIKGHKSDSADASQIAQYAFRFADQLNIWQPKLEIVEQLSVLLSTREQFVEQKTANANALRAIKRKVVQTPIANQLYHNNILRLKEQIKTIEDEIYRLINKDQEFKNIIQQLITIPGFGMLMATNLLVLTNGFKQNIDYKKLAAMFGICPYEHSSGSSVYRKPKSTGMGPPRIRKLLHLAARTVKQHNPKFQLYFARKLAEGKPKLLILNNIANKLLRIACAIIRDRQVFIPNYVSINPNPVKFA